VKGAAALILTFAAAPAAAEVSSEARQPPSGAEQDDAMRGRVLPEKLAPRSNSYFSVGVALERFGREVAGNDNLFGLAAMWRIYSFAPHALLMSKPSDAGLEDSRFLAGLGLRGYFPLLGTSFSYGVGVHAEMRLEDHYWLAYATPLELGAVIWAKDSWDIEIFVGARRAMAGDLINHFFIDPNGFDNENAREELNRLRTDTPWQGFLRLVFARRID
jgi:hypothetical protein